MFVGKTVPMIKLCLLQTSILQLFVFLTFILGNSYQSLIISLMSKSRDARYINSFEDLKKSDIFLIVDNKLKMSLELHDFERDWQKKLERVAKLSNNFTEYFNKNVAMIFLCEPAELLLYSAEAKHNSKLYYMIPEVLYSFNNFYSLGKDNLYADSFELFANKIFESGIRQYWKTLQFFNDERNHKAWNYLINEEYLLKMKDMIFIFYLLGFGLAVACVAFLFEVLWAFRSKIRLMHHTLKNIMS